MAVNHGHPKGPQVQIGLTYDNKPFYSVETIVVEPGDCIKWELAKELPFSIVVKAVTSPLESGFYTAAKGRPIVAMVREDAAPGYYPYAVSISDGEDIFVGDPEIIVRPPRGG